MAVSRYRIDPISGLVHRQTEFGEEPGIQVEAISQGALGISNGYIFGHYGDFTTRRIGTASESSLVTYGENKLEFINGINERSIGSAYSKSTQYGVSGDITVLTLSGENRTITIDIAATSRIGYTLLVHTGTDGKEEFVQLPAQFANITTIHARLGTSYRFATPEEARMRAVIGYLKGTRIGALREIIERGGINTPDGPITDISGLMRYIAQIGSPDLIAQSRTMIRLNPPEDE